MGKNSPTKNEEIALYYLGVFSETTREPFLILDSSLRILGASDPFYKKFVVTKEQIVNKFIYDLGNKQWDIPSLQKMLKEILPKNKIIKDFEVILSLPEIGQRTMLLNARQVDQVQLIILAIEDITARKELDNKLTNYSKDLEEKVAAQTKELSNKIEELESINEDMVGRELNMVALKKEIKELKKKIKNGNGKNGNHKNIK